MGTLNENFNQRDLDKEYKRVGKYNNINVDIVKKQELRFFKLFAPGEEKYIFLFLRAMNLYAVHQANFSLFHKNNAYESSFLISIFCDEYFSIIDKDFIDGKIYPEILKKQHDFRLIHLTSLPLLKEYFDLHFVHDGNYAIYKSLYAINPNQQFVYDDYTIFMQYKQHGLSDLCFKITPVNDDFLNFINLVMTSSNNRKNFYHENFWSERKFNLLKEYINNLFYSEIFQITTYERGLIRYNDILSEWNFNKTTGETKQTACDPNNLSLQIQKVYSQNNGISKNDDRFCINISLHKTKKSKTPNKALIKTYLEYFTMNKLSVLDSLSLDFVNSIILHFYSHKNTIISGDFDKFNKWRSMFGFDAVASLGLIRLYSFYTQIRIENLLNISDEDIESTIKQHTEETSKVKFSHCYFLIGSNTAISNSTLKKVNSIDFPYGGEFYSYAPLSNNDKLEIVKLLLIHGWHLLNNAKTQQKLKAIPSTENVLYKHLKNTDDTRIPLNVLHKIYNQFVDSQKTDTELQKELVANGFNYDTKAIRSQDKKYFKILSQEAEKYFCELKFRETPKQKAISCYLDPEFWQEISPERKKEVEDKNATEFDKYLKELSEKYAPFFIEEEPEKPINNDPLAGFVPLDKLKDEDLQ